jgi:signal peptidase II
MTTDRGSARRLRLTAGVALAIVALDQITKHWAVNALTDEPPRHVIWTLQWNLAFNRGMAFSKGQALGPIIGVAAIVIVVVVLVSVRKNTSWVVAAAAGFVVGGALGNLVDRCFRDAGWLRGSVVDFIDFQWFPIFNIADAGVNVGGALFVLWSLFAGHEPSAPSAATQSAPDEQLTLSTETTGVADKDLTS